MVFQRGGQRTKDTGFARTPTETRAKDRVREHGETTGGPEEDTRLSAAKVCGQCQCLFPKRERQQNLFRGPLQTKLPITIAPYAINSVGFQLTVESCQWRPIA